MVLLLMHSFDTKERARPEVPPPRAEQLTYSQIWNQSNQKYNLAVLSEHQAHEGRLNLALVQYLIEQGTQCFKADPVHITIPGKTLIIGDLHCLSR